jgi:lysophospholipase L1-like esterase
MLALAQSEHLAGLETLNLSNNRIGDEGARALANSEHLAGLRTLNLGGNDIGDEGARTLATSPHLHETIRRHWAGKLE